MKHQTKSSDRPALLVVSALLLFSGCSDDSNTRANQLHAEVSQELQRSRQEDKSYGEAWNAYKRAKSQMDRILSEYPSSDVAMGLSSGDRLTSGLTLDQFRGLEASLRELAEAEQYRLSLAQSLVRTLEEPGPKSQALCDIAGAYAEIGQSGQAVQLLHQALESARKWDEPVGQSYALTKIAAVYAGIGHAEQASRIFSDVLDAATRIEGVHSLWGIAEVLADAGAFDQALKVLEIIQSGETMKNAANITSVMEDLAVKAAKAGETEIAENLFSQLREFAHENGNEWHKSKALTDIAGLYAEAGLRDQASRLLIQAIESAKKIEQQESVAEVLHEIAGVYAKVGNKGKASQLLAQCLKEEMARETPYENARLSKAMQFTEIAGLYVVIGQKEEALPLLMQSVELAKSVEHPGSSSYAFCGIAGVYVEIGHDEEAFQLLIEALDSAKSIPIMLRESDRDCSFSEIGSLFAQLGEFEQAIEAVMMMEDTFLKSLELSGMASMCSTAGELSQLRVAAGMLEDEEVESWVVTDIAAGYARIGDFTQALKTTESLPNAEKSWATVSIVGELVKLSRDGGPSLVEATHSGR